MYLWANSKIHRMFDNDKCSITFDEDGQPEATGLWWALEDGGANGGVVTEPVVPLDFMERAFRTNGEARRWTTAFLLRRLAVVVTVVVIKSWVAQVCILVTLPVLWTLVREYFKPFKFARERWYGSVGGSRSVVLG